MTREAVSLADERWQLGSVPQKPFGPVDDLSQVREWIPAQVPGDVRLDLLHAGRISDPFYGTNNEASQWVDGLDWWYVRDLEIEPEAGERCFLVFEGIDYQSAVWYAGTLLGQHTGMFSRQTYEIKEAGGRQTPNGRLAVRVWGGDALPKMRLTLAQRFFKRLLSPVFAPPNELYPDRYATLKCQMQFGWDFAPRLRTCGIWDDVSLVKTRSVFILDAWVRGVPDRVSRTARVHTILTLDSDREQVARAIVTVASRRAVVEPQTFRFDLPLVRGKQTHPFEFDLQDARLWNPWDRGLPDLYVVQIQLESAVGLLDTYTTTIGLRLFELVPTAGADRNAEAWSFVINGQREFLRGANWVPLDAIPGRLTRDDYAGRLQQVRDAHINFLRVWGGGLKEKQAFYDLCDEFGILVWQEFPFAGAVLDRFPGNAEFLDLARAECGAIVRALRNHPSVVVWCGGNEFSTRGNRVIVETLREAVRREDGTRPFKPASPCDDESHNWRVWHRSANLREYRLDRTPFLSEFGLQSPPQVESLKQFLPEGALFPPGPEWLYHRASLGRLRRYAQSVRPAWRTVDEFVEASQRAQVLGLQIAIEHLRRGKPRTAGVAVWQFDDPWPAVSWSVVDYFGRPKQAYTMLQRVYSPVLASFEYPLKPRRPGDRVLGNLWLVNDWMRNFKGVELRATLKGKRVDTRTCDLAADSSVCIGALEVILEEGDNILRLELRDGQELLSANEYDLNFCDSGEMNPVVRLAAALYSRLMR